MRNFKELAAFGLLPSDFETSSLQDIAAAAQNLERLLNDAPSLIDIEIRKTEEQHGAERKNYFSIVVTSTSRVYP